MADGDVDGDRGQRGSAEPAGSANRTGPHPPQPWLPPGASKTPNAERYLLEADALRRRQLVSALLHGSRRTWREQRRIWPGVMAGIVVVAVIVAVFGVLRAVHSSSSSTGSVRTSAPSSAAEGGGLDRMGDLHVW